MAAKRVERSTRATSRGRGRDQPSPSPAMSDSSELSVLSRTPSPPPALRGRQASPALSDSSELSVLSRTPSPPPGLFQKDKSQSGYSPTLKLSQRGPNGHLIRNNHKRVTSPIPPLRRPSKRLRLPAAPTSPLELTTPKKAPTNPRSPGAPRKYRSLPSPRSPNKEVTTPFSATAVRSGSGNLDRLPKEIRQRIYACCLNIDDPVCVKQCCGPTSTRRERASCKKHGDDCRKIGKGNGLTLYKEDEEHESKRYGRFNVLSLSRAINEEASWVLYNQHSVFIQSTRALQAYLSEAQCTFYRLPNHATEHAKRMWLSVARFRNVCLELPWHELSLDDPVECVYRLYKAAAFLMKAWSMQVHEQKPTLSPTVTVQLNALYTSILPFNSDTSMKLAYEWTAYWQPHLAPGYFADFSLIGEKTEEVIERLLDLVGRHGGSSHWKVIAQAHRDDELSAENDDHQTKCDIGGADELRSLERCCALNGVALEIST